MPLLGAQLPSGRQHEVTQVHLGGPASITPASTTGSASHFAAAQRSSLVHFTQSSPPTPHSDLLFPGTHSPSPAQQPSQVERSQGRGHPLNHTSSDRTHQRMCGAL